jgi:hypothetical protein
MFVNWLRSLQSARLYAGARNLIIAWTLICALSLIAGLLNVLHGLPSPIGQAIAETVTVSFWTTVWLYPTLGLAIIAFVTKPRMKATGGH